jgi:hypothetical protein
MGSLGIAADSWRHDGTGMVFPARLGGLLLQGTESYGQQELGASVRYEGPQFLKADVFLYTLGIQQIPDGIDSELVKKHFESVSQDVLNAVRRGWYSSLVEVGHGTVQLGTSREGQRALYRCFEYDQNPSPTTATLERRRSYVILTGYRNHFVKIRFTFLANTKSYGELALKRFLIDLGRLFKKTGPSKGRDAPLPVTTISTPVTNGDDSPQPTAYRSRSPR